MNHSIEVAHLVNGEVISVRRLSRRREIREVAVAVGVVAGAFASATGLVAAVLLGAHRVVYGPVYGAVWLAVAASMGLILGRRALERARRYRVGVSIDDTREKLTPFVKQLNMKYVVLQGLGHDDVQDAYGPMWGFP